MLQMGLTKLPNAPSNVTVGTTTATSVELSWSPVLYVEGIQKYNVYRDGTIVGSPITNSYSDAGLTASTEYTYEIAAVGNDGTESPKSVPVKATTTA